MFAIVQTNTYYVQVVLITLEIAYAAGQPFILRVILLVECSNSVPVNWK